MPITIVDPIGVGFGPGVHVGVVSDMQPHLPLDTRWDMTVTTVDPENVLLSQVLNPGDNGADGLVGWQSVTGTIGLVEHVAPQGTPIRVAVVATDTEGGLVDAGSDTRFRWEPTAAAWALTTALLERTGSGGLTDEQSQQLANTDRRTLVLGEPTDLVVEGPSGPLVATLAQLFSRQTLDRLTLVELTNGPTCEPVRSTFSFWYWGVIVRVTTIAEDLIGKTPDHQWYFPDLAVLRIFRGQDLQFRQGIHTPTYLTERAWEFRWNIRNTLDFLGVPPDNTLAVDWREGCCGQVYLLKFPG